MSNLITIDLDTLAADIELLKKQLSEKEAVLRVATTYAVVRDHSGATPHFNGSTTSTMLVTPEALKGKNTPEAAAIVLRAAGKPMKTADIVTALNAAGFGRGLKNIKNTIFTAMDRRKSTFKKSGPGTWDLVPDSNSGQEN